MKSQVLKALGKLDFRTDERHNTKCTFTKEFDVDNIMCTVDVTVIYSDDLEDEIDRYVTDFATYYYNTEEETELEFTFTELNKAIR